jgi:ferrochelatase
MGSEPDYDAVVVVSFGGPEGPDDIVPFLHRVTGGRDIPAERLSQVVAHYQLFDGVSPINGQNRLLVAALERELARRGPALPVYLGNRNWHPFLSDTLGQMADHGVKRALAFVTSAFSSYPGCRQYLDDIAAARHTVGDRAPLVDKLRLFYNHPGFIDAVTTRAVAALDQLPPEQRGEASLVFTAHSVPLSMATTSDYQAQLDDSAASVAAGIGENRPWQVVFQSRSGPPNQPWLEPDVSEHLEALAEAGVPAAVLIPIGFVSDHMEVVYDLDIVAGQRAAACGLPVARAATVGDYPGFVAMIRELIIERTSPGEITPRAIGRFGPWPDICPEGHCPGPSR